MKAPEYSVVVFFFFFPLSILLVVKYLPVHRQTETYLYEKLCKGKVKMYENYECVKNEVKKKVQNVRKSNLSPHT